MLSDNKQAHLHIDCSARWVILKVVLIVFISALCACNSYRSGKGV